MAKCVMVQGTMSGVGKSLLVTALCRIFRQDGYRVAPFKSQNMALNSYVTLDGLEMGRAQAVQAQAAGKEPDVRMNPILLKPSSDVGSQLIVLGEIRGDYRAADYFKQKKQLIPEILRAYHQLAAENDILVIEGAGSPVELNLRADDIVNMGLAELVNAPVILVGDIDPGGVFAQIYGTMALLQPAEKRRVVGTVINKFRGDPALLAPGPEILENLTGVPVLGVIPYTDADIDDEDSLSPRLLQKSHEKPADIAVLRFPHISNFTDFAPLENHPSLGVRYVERLRELGAPDLIILPGTKSTMADLSWLKETGLARRIRQLAAAETPVLGICGGYQMLCETLRDPDSAETGGVMDGLGLLPCSTQFALRKQRTRVQAEVLADPFAGAAVTGYEIHMGRTERFGAAPFCRLSDGQYDGARAGNVFGTYLHGLFDSGTMTEKLAAYLLCRKGLPYRESQPVSREKYREEQYDHLADTVRNHLDLSALYRAMEEFSHE